ncbi:MAG TPA: hypothetical protein VGK86_03220 [Thermoanaerobaculia bacterium]|jgi:hypothetical protein
MSSSGKKWKVTLTAGLLGSALLAGVALGAEGRMQTQRPVATRSAPVPHGRVVGFKPERTDSWLCEYVSPFFCGYVPTVTAAPQPSATTAKRGRP